MKLYSVQLPYVLNAGKYFAAIRELPWAAWLDSSSRGRYDILVAQPVATLITRGMTTVITHSSGVQISASDPFELLRDQLGDHIFVDPEIPFCGGALGYWSYDLARRWINLSKHKSQADGLPDMAIGIYDWAVVVDHEKREARLLSHLQAPETEASLPEILRRLQACATVENPEGSDFRVTGAIQSNFQRSEYQAAFNVIRDYLIAGDCYQVNLAQRFCAPATGDAFRAYLKMREITPAPYSAFLNFPDAQIMSVSPERFLSVKNRQVETKPIKGTRQRGKDRQHDQLLKQDLLGNPKDRAENLMIVDLLRNDMSKSCAVGSIRAPKLFEVESYANVHHLVSTITGKLAAGKDALSLFKDCFPGGSITGAPKQRAMEIIEQLEPQPRGIYCGAIGYIGWDGNMDSNIAIRTLIYSRGEIHFSAGGGIVADSQEADEFQETLDKASGMMKLLNIYR
ncbi:MAG: aminodeoxychorismate synthase component I [Gallionellaceae bacterium]|jgi:para-aminobenzoate synthetase component 1